jgi:predicted component of type VI protein secretion system
MEAIELTGSSLRLGRDANLADAIFNDRSVSRLHARIEIANGVFKILDEGSTSGTWVNFNQIPAQGGHELKPGDLINLGRVQLRFQVREAALTGALGSANGTSAHAPQTSDTAAGHSDMADIPQRHRPVKPPSTD